MSRRTATCVETRRHCLTGKPDWKLYALSPPLATKRSPNGQLLSVSHVLVELYFVQSSVDVAAVEYTYVFGSDRYGTCLTVHLCRVRGGFDPKKALSELGYQEIEK